MSTLCLSQVINVASLYSLPVSPLIRSLYQPLKSRIRLETADRHCFSELIPCCSSSSGFSLSTILEAKYGSASYGSDIAVFKRAQQVATWSKHNAKVNFLLLFGKHIISFDAHGGMFIWALKGIDQNLAPFEHMKLDDKFIVSCKIHPDTYLNKVLIGSEQELVTFTHSTRGSVTGLSRKASEA
ncbi:hypothetical protein K1719_032981 [Acacia pycnantha]|nr:hypothetical protein K1719_032981 [Acacia pycnantha]